MISKALEEKKSFHGAFCSCLPLKVISDKYSTYREKDKICSLAYKKCASSIIGNHRKGNLAVARAFGDFQYKRAKDKEQLEQPVSCLPDVHFFERSSDDEYIVMACDGVYDVLSNDELVSEKIFVEENCKSGVFGINTEVSSHASILSIYRFLYISFSINHLSGCARQVKVRPERVDRRYSRRDC